MKPLEVLEKGRFLGEEFLVWLWMRGLNNAGESGQPNDTSACYIDATITFVNERGEIKKLTCQGNPAESREAFEALSRGMRPSRAKIRLLSGDMEWSFTLEAATMAVSGLKMPPTESKDLTGRLADRLFLVEECLAHLDRRFEAFINARTQDPDKLLQTFKDWIGAGADAIGREDEGTDNEEVEVGAHR